MVKKLKITQSDYYLTLPSFSIETGDIWTNIPTLGLLDIEISNAIIINPSCDLAQEKTRIITLLPIIKIKDYIYSPEFYHEMQKDFSKLFSEYNLKYDRYNLPQYTDILKIIEDLSADKANKKINNKLKEFAKYITYQRTPQKNNKPDVSKIINIKAVIEKIIKNSYSSDIHYLPPDNEHPAHSTIEEHSVALFKYSVSYPYEIFYTAMSSLEELWDDDIKRLSATNKTAQFFKKYPVNTLTLKDDFLSDFMSRYLNMHLRFGSRDFSSDDINSYTQEIIKDL
ncbi:hypothetical protein LA366_04205 [Aeromonas jandaei]|uniref:Uncharacterized protein n=1 Tax=Aeromonas jandaei TaxID=650 RepID=A0A7T4A958_AERJA|nr:hypothetical protein [Aeromonas jandaei]QQB19620.1 hypothetical protein I6H43_19260 [Aeromonas jandaei]UCA34296.1 hypothetical protein LA366_04205 [Aeromonas jandaei]